MQTIKAEGQSVRKIEWKQTDAQTDGGDCITSRANYAVSKKRKKSFAKHYSTVLHVYATYVG